MNQSFKVVIIGAGIAGLGAGLVLTENGVNFTILEAMDRPGGRIESLQLSNGIIDIGAQWLHDSENYLYKTMLEHNLVDESSSEEGCGLFIRDDGLIFDEFLVKRVDFEIGRILEQCEKFVDCEEDSPHSVGEYLDHKFEEFLRNYEAADESCTQKTRKQMRELYNWHIKFQMIDNSCSDLNMLSAKEWGRYSCTDRSGQQHINVKGGFTSLIQLLVRKLPEKSIKFEQIMQSINFCDDSHSSSIMVHTQNAVIEAEYVIITCSLGVLKHFTSGQIPLNPHAAEVIDKMGFDAIGKVFLEFDECWWSWKGLQLIWRAESDLEGLPEWSRHISGFDCVLGQPNMLLGWVSHSGIAEIENIDDEDIGKSCVELLQRFLHNKNIPCARKVYKSTWLKNPFIRGAYGYITNKCDNGALPTGSVLSEPVCDKNKSPRIYLAGEAVSVSHFSTIHGAFESGYSQAQKLCKFFMKS